ncbi:MAG: class I SAM-dependent methyltransferase [Acidobacteria bacterium]|nr:class I SAM-dependent methyltransferase [Acidobacteriota bacterium]
MLTPLPTSPVTHRTDCRLCGSSRVVLAVPYPPTPVADAYLDSAEASADQPRFPLDLYLCEACGHVQLCDVVDPEVLFRQYTYETSVSLGLVAHFKAYAMEVAALAGWKGPAHVVEIGSNDGTLLRAFQGAGHRVLGVDPAQRIAEKATASGIPTIAAFFTRELALRIRDEQGPADLVTANNVFAHSDALGDMADGIAALLAPDGLFAFEVSYLPDILQRRLFDTVYHEHLCYHAIAPMAQFFRAHGLELVDVLAIPTKGGSFRGVVQLLGGHRAVAPSVGERMAMEAARGIGRLATYQAFAAELQAVRAELRARLTELRTQGKRIAGYGASATVTTLMHYFGLHEFLDFLVDDNARKHGTFAPGSALPVLPTEQLLIRRPDVVVILAWNYADAILTRQQAYRELGGAFLVPLPRVEFR